MGSAGDAAEAWSQGAAGRTSKQAVMKWGGSGARVRGNRGSKQFGRRRLQALAAVQGGDEGNSISLGHLRLQLAAAMCGAGQGGVVGAARQALLRRGRHCCTAQEALLRKARGRSRMQGTWLPLEGGNFHPSLTTAPNLCRSAAPARRAA